MNLAVKITWMDGREATYTASNVRVVDGVLHLTQSHYPMSDYPNWSFPISNIRVWETPS